MRIFLRFPTLRRILGTAGRCILFLAVVLVCALCARFSATIYGYLPLLTVLVLGLLSLFYLLLLRRQVDCTVGEGTFSCVRGQTISLSVELRNRSFLVCPRLDVCFFTAAEQGGREITAPASVTMAPFEQRTFSFDVCFAHLGQCQAGVESVEVFGPLGVLRFRRVLRRGQAVEVMPRVWRLPSMSLTDRVQTEDTRSPASFSSSGGDYTGVREYAFGDPIKSIHWKLSAHTGDYLTKQLETFGSAGLTVLPDFLVDLPRDEETSLCLYDTLAETAVSLCAYALAQGMDTEMVYYDCRAVRKRMVCRDETDFRGFVGEMPGFTEREEAYPVEELLREAARSSSTKNNVALVTTRVTEEIVRALEEIKMAGREPQLYFVLPTGLSPREEDRLLAPVSALGLRGISCHVVHDGAELEGGIV